MGRLDGKTALITGGARGQGAVEAERFVAEGATVVITDVRVEEGEATALRLGEAVTFLEHDVTSESGWQAVVAGMVESHGRIDILVNNAGIFKIARIVDTSLDDWNQMIAVNQTGVFLGVRECGQVMKAQGSGSIINISSVAGLGGVGIAHAYAASKWAVRGMTKSAALEFSRSGVRVNSVHPGIIETDMMHESGVPDPTAGIPVGRVGTAEEVANLVLFLASDEASYCNGHEFVVDGALKA
ncbi:MAG: 3alpha(or 20beta)-hydroxysteroid dehydrogenase [Ilumatobacter sp.]|jgi:3alpha(or 20beta)-hydroxysteroid dehydrogenase